MSGIFISGFLFSSTHISFDLISLGSAKAYIGWGGKLNGHLTTSCVRNIRVKNYQNLVIGCQVTVENVGDAFWGHSVVIIRFFGPKKIYDQTWKNAAHNVSKLITSLRATAYNDQRIIDTAVTHASARLW